MRVSPHILFKHCYGSYAIPAVNVFSLEQVHALFQASAQADSPIIVQLTPAARRYTHAAYYAKLIEVAASIYPEVVYAVHLDHGNETHCKDAIASGDYDSVMIDASHDPFSQNITRTQAVVKQAHQHNIFVEAELGVLSGVEDDISIDEKYALYTDPREVEEFVRQTKCNSLAVAVGTSHGAYKFSGGQGLQLDILADIQRRLPGFPLVLHGGSGVNAVEVQRINKAGGKLQANAKGVDPMELQQAIKLGICKVNIATDMRLLWTRTHREFFRDQPDQIDLIPPGKAYMEAYISFMLEKFKLLGSTNQSKHILQTTIS